MSNQRRYIRDILLEQLSYSDAKIIFQRYGVDVSNMKANQLHIAYRDLIRRYHPDNGGNVKDAQDINAAYDVLKNNDGRSNIFTSQYSTQRNKKQNEYGDIWNKEYEPWRWAGWSGGSPPSASVGGKQDYNYIKKRIWEISGRPMPPSKEHEWTFICWDGYYFRGSITAYCDVKKLFEASKMVSEWESNLFNIIAIFCYNRSGIVWLVNYKDNKIGPITLDHNSFNSNPANDQEFVEFLRKNLDDMYRNPEKYD